MTRAADLAARVHEGAVYFQAGSQMIGRTSG